MVKIRLQRYGSKKRPFYRVVASDSRMKRDGRFIELLGTFDPISYDGKLNLKQERIQYWLGKGANPSQTVVSLLKKEGLLQTSAS